MGDWLLRLALGAIIGFCIGLTGIGGGALVLPSLTVALGLPASVAVGTASLYAFVTKCYATWQHVRLKTVDLRMTLLILLGAVPGNVGTAWGINRTVGRLSDPAGLSRFQDGLKTFIAVVVLFSAVVLVVDLLRKGRGIAGRADSADRTRLRARPAGRGVLAALLGLVIGALIGATSVGGGVLLIPALIMLFGLPPTRTVGTSIFVATVLTLVTALVYGRGGQMDWQTALLMAGGSLAGVPVGSRLCARLCENRLRAVVTSVVFVSALLMFFKGAGSH